MENHLIVRFIKIVDGERSPYAISLMKFKEFHDTRNFRFLRVLTGGLPIIFECAQKYTAFSRKKQTSSAGQVDQQYISDTLISSG